MVAHMRYSTCAFLLLIPLLPGCSGDERATTLTSPSSAALPPAVTQSTLHAWVYDTAMRPLAGARIEVADGASAGASVVTSGNGQGLLTGAFDGGTHFRAVHDGHESVVQKWSCPTSSCGFPWTSFYLRPLSPPAIDLSGEYTMTITANASCEMLPPESRSRTYPVTLSPRMRPGTADVMGFTVLHHSGAVVDAFRHGYVGVAGNYARSYVIGGEGDQPGLVGWLDDTGYVAFMGTAEAALYPGASPATLSFNGQVEYLQLRAPIPSNGTISGIETRLTCTSSEHRMVLTRM